MAAGCWLLAAYCLLPVACLFGCLLPQLFGGTLNAAAAATAADVAELSTRSALHTVSHAMMWGAHLCGECVVLAQRTRNLLRQRRRRRRRPFGCRVGAGRCSSRWAVGGLVFNAVARLFGSDRIGSDLPTTASFPTTPSARQSCSRCAYRIMRRPTVERVLRPASNHTRPEGLSTRIP